MNKIGVFVCWCGENIAGVVDVERAAKRVHELCPDVIFAQDYIYMCSEPGQNLIKESIKKYGLNGVAVCSCSPTLHEVTFRNAVKAAGLNPYRCEIANIREQCSWVHRDREVATEKAVEIILSTVEKIRLNIALESKSISITRRALVIGGGIAGMQAALDIANCGFEVVLVEKSPSIGGHMSKLSETFPTLDCASCTMTPKMVETGQHPNIKLMTYSEIEEIKGYVGNFKVRIRRKAAFVNWDRCTGCGVCTEKCPINVVSDFNEGLGKRKAIFVPFPQAVPNKPTIDRENCTYLKKKKCGLCKTVCKVEAIAFEQEDSFVDVEVGVVVLATGYKLMDKSFLGEYGAGKYKDVIDGLQFERLLSASGPTSGEIRRPSDGKVPGEVVFIQCAGSRDPENGVPHCSKICCMYTAKHAKLYQHKVHGGKAYVFYIDIRSAGKGYEEFVQRTMENERVLYLRGKVSKVFEADGKVVVWGVDTLTNRAVEIKADLVVLAMAMLPGPGTIEIAKKLKLATNEEGFLKEAHIKLRPVETLAAGFFIAGCAQGPKDIPETVAQASGAAAKAITILSSDTLTHSPTVATVDTEICSGCGICESICTYDAARVDPERGVSIVNEILCEGCGACAAACPSGAIEHINTTKRQIFEMIDVFTK